MNYNKIPLSTIKQYNTLTSKLLKQKNYIQNNLDNELIMYNIIFPYLKLGKGKIISQISHGIQQSTEYMLTFDKNLYRNYIEDCVKITLKINSEDEALQFLDSTINLKKFLVIDGGRTQCSENTLTCITFLPLKRKNVPIEIKNLNLY